MWWCSICCFKSLMQVSNQSRSAIKRLRFIYAIRYCNHSLNFFTVFVELIQSTSTLFSFNIKISCAWIKVLSCSSACFFKNELFSILIIFSMRLCENDYVESSQLRAWLRISRSRLNIVANWVASCEGSN